MLKNLFKHNPILKQTIYVQHNNNNSLFAFRV